MITASVEGEFRLELQADQSPDPPHLNRCVGRAQQLVERRYHRSYVLHRVAAQRLAATHLGPRRRVQHRLVIECDPGHALIVDEPHALPHLNVTAVVEVVALESGLPVGQRRRTDEPETWVAE